jgi:hypothetical protein
MSGFNQMTLNSVLIFLNVTEIGAFASTSEDHMKKRYLVIRNVVGTGTMILGAAGLLFGGYVFVIEIPDIKRYLKISRM